MVDRLTIWPREREGVPFDTEAFNRLINFLNGYLAAPFTLVQTSGSQALDWDPTTDLFTFNASAVLNASVTLGNTIWLEGFRSDNTTKVNLIRVSSGNIIQLGASGELLAIQAPLQNNTNLSARNAANSASVTLIKLNTSDIIETGEATVQHNLLGTVKAPAIDPPTTDGQVTEMAVCKALYFGSFSGGSLVDGDNYNVASATKNATGDYTITWDRDFAAADYVSLVTIDASTRLMWRVLNKAAGSLDIRVETTAGANTDPDGISIACFGQLS